MKGLATTLLLAACLAAHSASYTAYAVVTGQKQGTLHGAGRSKSHRIPIVSLDLSSSDEGGKSSLTIDAVDVGEFLNALAKHEVLLKIKITEVRPTRTGQVVPFMEVDMKNAVVQSVNQHFGGRKHGHSSGEWSQVKLTYQKVSTKRIVGKVLAQDDWKN